VCVCDLVDMEYYVYVEHVYVTYVLMFLYRTVLHRSWLCQHSWKNKACSGKQASKGTGCTASVDIKIKKVNRNTKKNDEFLRRSPPLAAVIKVSLEHNHSTESADALRYVQLSDEVTDEFQQYFDSGLQPGAAIHLHEDKILTGQWDCGS